MPVPKGTKFRIRTYPSGKRVRLAIYNGKVIETKSLSSKKNRTSKRLNRKLKKLGV